MHVAPLAHDFRPVDVIVRHIHATHVGDASVNDHNLPVVTLQDMIHVREADGVEGINLDSQPAQLAQVTVLQRLVVGHVPEVIKQGTHLHAFLHFLRQQGKERIGNGVVAKVEIFQVYMMPGTAHLFKQICKLVLTAFQQFHLIAFGHLDTGVHQEVFHYRVAAHCRLCPQALHRQQTGCYPNNQSNILHLQCV